MLLRSHTIGSKLPPCCMIYCNTCTAFAIRNSSVLAMGDLSSKVLCDVYSVDNRTVARDVPNYVTTGSGVQLAVSDYGSL